MTSRVEGKVAIATGGGTSIGRATARSLVVEGVIVTVTDLNVKAGKAVADELGRSAIFVQQHNRMSRVFDFSLQTINQIQGRAGC